MTSYRIPMGSSARIQIAVLLCGICSVSAYAAEDDGAARQHFLAAQQAQNAGQLDYAADEYRKVIQLAPQAAEAWASLGLVYNAQRKYADSAKALSAAEKLKPGLPGVSLYIGIDYLRQHQAALAIPHLQHAVRVEPKNEQVYTWLTEAYTDEGKLDAAIDSLHKATLLFATDPVLLLDLSRLYRRAANEQIAQVLRDASGPLRHQIFADIYKDEHFWQNARAHYYKALEEDPHWPGAHFGIGEIAFANKQLDAASVEYRKELQIDPHSGDAMARLAEIALLQGSPTEALHLFSSAISFSPDQAAHAVGLPPSYPPEQIQWSDDVREQLRRSIPTLTSMPPGPARSLALALVNLRLGNTDEYAAAWNDFVAQRPATDLLRPYNLAVQKYDRMDLDGAQAAFRSWIAVHPGDERARYLLGRTWQTLSFSTLAKLLSSSPDSYPAHEAMAEIYRENQKSDRALDEYALAEHMAPDAPGLHLAMGTLLLELHRPDDALKELQAEVTLNPDSVGANKQIGQIYLDRSDSVRAIPYLQRAVQQDGNLWSARQQLGKAYYLQKDFAQAASQLQAVLAHDSDGSAHFQLGLVYKALGQNQKAKEEFDVSRTIKIRSLAHAETELSTFQSLSQ